jgi:chromosome segregation ATPase
MLEIELAEARLRTDEEAERADGFRAGRDSLASDHDGLHGRIESLERELGAVTGQRDEGARALELLRAERDGLASETQWLRSREAALVADLAASSSGSGSRDESWWQPIEVESVQAERDEAVAENVRLRAERDAATREAMMHEGGLRAVEDRLAEVQASLQSETARSFRLQAELASMQEAAMAELAFGVHDRARD